MSTCETHTSFRPATRRANPVAWAFLAIAAWRQRRALAALPRHRLDDMGISPEQARLEADKPGWNVPAHWLR